ncbi:hypothetical protein [Candidatus Leptofilum sp.]|uniref:hypothetical protein n=1 Tax=Candidatus Leptofilum sp. TaxID=3241576 RepID=UPI003B59C513
MNKKTKKTIVESILRYLVFSGILLIVTMIWYPDRLQDTVIVAIFAPIMLLVFITPILLIIFVWIKKAQKNDPRQ